MLRVLLIVLLVLIASPIIFLFLAMEPAPIVTEKTASTPETAARTREIALELIGLTESGGENQIRLSQDDFSAVLASAMRALPQMRAVADIEPDGVHLALSADASRIPGGSWLNLRTAIAPSRSGLQLAYLRFGGFSLPPGPALQTGAFVLDLVLGDRLATSVLGSIEQVSIAESGAAFDIGPNIGTRSKRFAGRLQQLVRSAANISSTEKIGYYYDLMDIAAQNGEIPDEGSVLPFLRFAMRQAHLNTTDGDGNDESKAALFALAIYCGNRDFQTIVGEIAEVGTRNGSKCGRTTLNRRRDWRRHFVISAGLEAASNSGFAFAIGEFKELIDSNPGGSGFSFDDLAADLAGIRFAQAFLASTPDQRERLLQTMDSENALFPVVDDLLLSLSDQEFVDRFGNVESEAYRGLVSAIQHRINRLPLYDPK